MDRPNAMLLADHLPRRHLALGAASVTSAFRAAPRHGWSWATLRRALRRHCAPQAAGLALTLLLFGIAWSGQALLAWCEQVVGMAHYLKMHTPPPRMARSMPWNHAPTWMAAYLFYCRPQCLADLGSA
jgi:hypothetical protein